jgi:hypothetical protein
MPGCCSVQQRDISKCGKKLSGCGAGRVTRGLNAPIPLVLPAGVVVRTIVAGVSQPKADPCYGRAGHKSYPASCHSFQNQPVGLALLPLF